MRWGSIRRDDGRRSAALLVGDKVVTMWDVNEKFHRKYPLRLEDIICDGIAGTIDADIRALGGIQTLGVPANAVEILAPMSSPERIAGIGLNYRAHAQDLSEMVPEEPATFLKPTSSIIGPGEMIEIPQVSERTTAEAELALVFGRTCKNVPEHAWRDVVFGIVPVLDMTTEDILRKNSRFLTRSKGYDTFFSYGPWIATLDEFPELETITVETVINGEVRAQNRVSGMVYDLANLVQFITTDVAVGATAILSTGTPGAGVITAGDRVEARLKGLGTLVNPVARARS